MSAYREEKPLTEDDRFTFEDSQILKELRESDRQKGKNWQFRDYTEHISTW